MNDRWSPAGLGKAFAILSAIYMLFLSIGAWTGTYTGTAEAMQQWHLFYDPSSVVGTLMGVIEGAIHGFIAGYLLAWLYNSVS
jgi:hypothetical protein